MPFHPQAVSVPLGLTGAEVDRGAQAVSFRTRRNSPRSVRDHSTHRNFDIELWPFANISDEWGIVNKFEPLRNQSASYWRFAREQLCCPGAKGREGARCSVWRLDGGFIGGHRKRKGIATLILGRWGKDGKSRGRRGRGRPANGCFPRPGVDRVIFPTMAAQVAGRTSLYSWKRHPSGKPASAR